MEELDNLSPGEKKAFKKHYSQIHRAFGKLVSQIKNNRYDAHLHQSELKSSRRNGKE